jgi:cytochrome P450
MTAARGELAEHLGARLARFETRLVIEILTERIPTLRLAPDQRLDYFPNITFRGPTRLHVEWDWD